MLDVLEKNNKTILQLKQEVKTQDKEILSLRDKIKQLIRKSSITPSPTSHKEQEITFPTEIGLDKSILRSQQSYELLDKHSQYHTINNP